MELQKLLQQYENAGKIEKMNILTTIFLECLSTRNIQIYRYFDDFTLLLKEYLEFDPKPNETIRITITKNFNLLFRFIKYSNNLNAFNNYYPIYQTYQDLLLDNLEKAELFQHFGYFFWSKNDTETSINYLSYSLKLANESGNIDAIPRRYTNLGYLYETIGDLEKAEYYYLQGLDFGKKYNSQTMLKLSYDAMGRLNLARNNINIAIDYFKESLLFYNEEKSMDKISVTSNLASCYIKSSQFNDALKLYKSILTEWLKKTNSFLYYSILGDSAVCYLNLKNYEKAKSILTEAINFAENNNVLENIIPNYLNLSLIHYKEEDYPTVLKILKKAEGKISSNNYRQKANIFHLKGKVYFKQAKYKKALTFFQKSYKIAEKIKIKHEQAKILMEISNCYEEIGNYRESLTIFKRYTELIKDCYRENQQKDSTENVSLIGIGNNRHLVFKNASSLISRELTNLIKSPFIGKSQKMQYIIKHAIIMAGNPDASILIKGESGTGKEILAKLIHYSSPRKNFPFIPINSAMFTKGIAQSTLFGHQKGSFTGAIKNQKGYLESAKDGTIFFDEIGDMPLDIQAKLLRALEEKEITPLGYNKPIKVNFRMISATNIDIYKLVDENKFRFDFLNRINTLEIEIPPLRERKEDIPLLIDYFTEDISNKLKIKKPKFSDDALKFLFEYNYPGNVRELQNIIERLLMFCHKDKIINIESLQFLQPASVTTKKIYHKTLNLEENEKKLIIEALKRTNNIKCKAAELLGITPYSLLRRLKKYNLD